MAKQALGKGLGALIRKQGGDDPAAPPEHEAGRVSEVAIESVVPSPLQPRSHFVDQPLDELVESIRQHGVIQPLIVRRVDGKLELIAGERRWRASKKLGLKTVPVIEREASDRDVLEMALIENLQREDLNPIEAATGYVRLAREFGMKQEEIAATVGKSRASVANSMRLLDLHKDVQLLVAHGQITVGHAKAILTIKDKAQQVLASETIIRDGLTVRAAEKFAQQLGNGELKDAKAAAKDGGGGAKGGEVDHHVRAIQNRLRDRFATHVRVQHGAKKGKIELEYYGDDDLQRILDLLGIGEL